MRIRSNFDEIQLKSYLTDDSFIPGVPEGRLLQMLSGSSSGLEADEEVRLIIVLGEGERAFCSGGDVKAVAAARGKPDQREFIQREYRLDLLISRLKTPYLAVWDGLVMGGGMGISRMGLLRLATERTVWALPEVARQLELQTNHLRSFH